MQNDILFEFDGGRRGIFAHKHWVLRRGEQWALTGPSASGKSLLCAYLAGSVPVPFGATLEMADELDGRVAAVSFAQQQLAAQRIGFLQARYYAHEEDAVAVSDFLSFNTVFEVNPFEVGVRRAAARREYARLFAKVTRLLSLSSLLPRPFAALSNGETRRVLLARALLTSPQLLILDDPAAGLDAAQRTKLKDLLCALARRGLTIIMTFRHADELPSCITHTFTLGAARALAAAAAALPPPPPDAATSRPIVQLRNINISFGSRILFKNLNWTIREGEHWLLSGANGSGKTTLLSLITGDNPQAYSNDVTVFDQRRAPGIPLWHIRRRIGTLSPEAQSYFDQTLDVFSAVLAGRINSDGIVKRPTAAARAAARKLLRAFGLAPRLHLLPFGALSSGEQRLVLAARALIAEPDLLLLDEPCMNLDAQASAAFMQRIMVYLARHPSLTTILVSHRPLQLTGFQLFAL